MAIAVGPGCAAGSRADGERRHRTPTYSNGIFAAAAMVNTSGKHQNEAHSRNRAPTVKPVNTTPTEYAYQISRSGSGDTLSAAAVGKILPSMVPEPHNFQARPLLRSPTPALMSLMTLSPAAFPHQPDSERYRDAGARDKSVHFGSDQKK